MNASGRVLNMGGYDVLTRPFDKNELIRAVSRDRAGKTNGAGRTGAGENPNSLRRARNCNTPAQGHFSAALPTPCNLNQMIFRVFTSMRSPVCLPLTFTIMLSFFLEVSRAFCAVWLPTASKTINLPSCVYSP